MGSEQWREIEGFSKYLVSDHGVVMHQRTKRELKGFVIHSGDVYVCLQTDEGKQVSVPIKWLVIRAFTGLNVKGRYIKNLDGDKTNLVFTNLVIMRRV